MCPARTATGTDQSQLNGLGPVSAAGMQVEISEFRSAHKTEMGNKNGRNGVCGTVR